MKRKQIIVAWMSLLLLAVCPAYAQTHAPKVIDTDIVVMGAGASGTAAAFAAAELSAKVVMIEKQSTPGGTGNFSEGIFAVESSMQRAMNYTLSKDQAFKLIMDYSHWRANAKLVRSVRSDALIATGRSDYPNQVNNVLCFPYMFRGALDVGATAINEEMKLACAHALAAMPHSNPDKAFGADYLIPSPFETRLRAELPMAVARAAMESGVATRPITDWDAYRRKLSGV